MNDTYESRCRLLLHAYPPRYRAAREAEFLGTLLDAAPPGATRPSIRDSWDIVRGGLTTRLRNRPAPHHWLAYRLSGTRVPYRHRMWVRDDALGRFFVLRRNIVNVLAVWGGITLVMNLGTPGWNPFAAEHGPTRWVFIAILVLAILNPLWAKRDRARILRKHAFADDGTDPTALPPDRP
ncbi:hypothetical protein [Streptomyces sp. SID3343]|uniref:hypothetical protein n=1 Tax=Streptomyces sp. SID3343 TaxID=2690260 RepID=UPI00136A6903|nr:hypothetical protein [Streptomyces sp. SID3343]MYV96973.1 hypothetical protein [Streptomyces sp. SID3343]MYW06747.1 hypothetical protein [Streptomyces sp. SID3343]